MVHNPKDQEMFPRLPVEKIRELCAHGQEVSFKDGETLFREGELNYAFYVVLEGRVKVTKRASTEEMLLTYHEAGQFTGDIAMLTGTPARATVVAEGAARAMRFDMAEFRMMLAECPDLASTVLRAFAARAREVDATMIQQEKLASMGKMAAGLAHELNNPAAAMVRTMESLRGAISGRPSLVMKYDCPYHSKKRPILEQLQSHVRERAS